MRIESSEPQMTGLISQLPTMNQMTSETYQRWLAEMREQDRVHRKQWEYVYILQALLENNLLKSGVRGVGFGVGKEPIPAVLANRGCTILATEINIEKPNEGGWVKGKSVDQMLEDLNDRGICDSGKFAELVSFRDIDMNNIPPDISNFDFTWSCCSLEHLGSLRRGEDFIFNSLKCLKPGGLAVHTTEFTLAKKRTVESGSTVFYRKSDIISLAQRLEAEGHEIALNFSNGRRFLDWYVDFSPYRNRKHLKLIVSKQWKLLLATSIGLIIKKKPG